MPNDTASATAPAQLVGCASVNYKRVITSKNQILAFGCCAEPWFYVSSNAPWLFEAQLANASLFFRSNAVYLLYLLFYVENKTGDANGQIHSNQMYITNVYHISAILNNGLTTTEEAHEDQESGNNEPCHIVAIPSYVTWKEQPLKLGKQV